MRRLWTLGSLVVIANLLGAAAVSAAGPTWSLQSTPNPSSSTNRLLSVACPSTDACIAVGQDKGSGGKLVTLAEEWDGTAWSVQSTPVPSGARLSGLAGVSCASRSVCVAVGQYRTAAGVHVTLAEGWDGTTWTIEPTPNPSGATFSRLLGVSCWSTTACTAAGYATNGSGVDVPLAMRWSGATWSLESVPSPGASMLTELLGVSCTSPSACTAVGQYEPQSGVFVPLAERWNGGAWSLQKTPALHANDSVLESVSCISNALCIAVGLSGGNSCEFCTLAEQWNGAKWSVQSTPNPPGFIGNTNARLLGVSCASTSVCTGVGWYENTSGLTVTLAEHWSGATWKIQPTPNPAGSNMASALLDVSCTATTTCSAVGDLLHTGRNAGPLDTLAERYV
jgi:hypothetical protein